MPQISPKAMEVNIAPALSVNTRTQVLALEFSPYEWSRGLLAVALPTSVAVYSIKFKVLLVFFLHCLL